MASLRSDQSQDEMTGIGLLFLVILGVICFIDYIREFILFTAFLKKLGRNEQVDYSKKYMFTDAEGFQFALGLRGKALMQKGYDKIFTVKEYQKLAEQNLPRYR